MFVFRPEEVDPLGNALSSLIKNTSVSNNSTEYPSKVYLDKESGAIVCKMLVPGFTSSDIEASYDNGTLIVSGYSSRNMKIWSDSFKKRFSINKDLFDLNTASFKVEDGILTFSIQKASVVDNSISFEIK